MRATPRESNRWRPDPPPAADPGTTQAVEKLPPFRRRRLAGATLAEVARRMEGGFATRATFLACCPRKVDVDVQEEIENPCVQTDIYSRRDATAPSLCCRTRLCAHKIPGSACCRRPRGSRLLSQHILFTQRVGAGIRTDSDLGSQAGDSPSKKVRTHILCAPFP